MRTCKRKPSPFYSEIGADGSEADDAEVGDSGEGVSGEGVSAGVSGKFSSSIPSPSLALVSASTNSLLLPYFFAEYSFKIGTIFLFW